MRGADGVLLAAARTRSSSSASLVAAPVCAFAVEYVLIVLFAKKCLNQILWGGYKHTGEACKQLYHNVDGSLVIQERVRQESRELTP